ARTRSRSYARLERERSFIQYGDFQTAGPSRLHALGVFTRSLNGGISHFEWSRGAVEAFASRAFSSQVVDELPALGVSGPYLLSRPDGLINSEQVEIVTRDRDRPSVIIRRQPQQRFVDYSI